jgi:hypothetical protein
VVGGWWLVVELKTKRNATELSAVVLTQRGGSCPRSFPFVLGAKTTRHVEWRLRPNENDRGHPLAAGWRRQHTACLVISFTTLDTQHCEISAQGR